MDTVLEIIRALDLSPLRGEGGLYRQTYRSPETIPPSALPARYTGARRFCSAIYYLLTDEQDSFSALHRLVTDEIYHFYLGDPLEMLLLLPGGASQRALLGPDLLAGQQLQWVVPAGVWQGSRVREGGRFALLGTTMAPGYETADFTLGDRAELQAGWPQEAAGIARLTRI